MNQSQLQSAHLKQIIHQLEKENKELKAALEEKGLLDRLLIGALTGASARLTDPSAVAKFGIDTAQAVMEYFQAAAQLDDEAESTNEPKPI